jgi:hypothetical protein
VDIEEQLRRWGAEKRRQAATDTLDPVPVIREDGPRRSRSSPARLVAPAAAAISVVAVVAAIAVVMHRDGSSGRHASTAAITGPRQKTAGPATIGCGTQAPPDASTAGYRASLAVGSQHGTWQLTITNGTRSASALNRKVDLVAVNSQRRIIAAERVPDAGGSSENLRPGESWTATIRPVANDCAAPAGPTYPPISPGVYEFVATFFVGTSYLSSNPIFIDVNPDGSFSPH